MRLALQGSVYLMQLVAPRRPVISAVKYTRYDGTVKQVISCLTRPEHSTQRSGQAPKQGRALRPGLWRAGADRYFGSFPKVGIVIPNPSTWLLPEFQDLASALERTLMLPPNGQLSNGVSLQPDSDGFLIFLPSGAHPRQHSL